VTARESRARRRFRKAMWWIGGILTLGYTLKEGVERFL
jgi:hypothetical protein